MGVASTEDADRKDTPMRRMLARTGITLLPIILLLAATADAPGWASTWALLAAAAGTWSVMTLWSDRLTALFDTEDAYEGA